MSSDPVIINQPIIAASISHPRIARPSPATHKHDSWGKKRPYSLPGTTYKTRHPDKQYRVYVTINDCPGPDERLRPFEIFLSANNRQLHQWMTFAAMSITRNLRHRDTLAEIIDDMKSIADADNSGYLHKGTWYGSIIAEVGHILEKHVTQLSRADRPPPPANHQTEHNPDKSHVSAPAARCPKCNSTNLIRAENCDTCLSCGHSRCGD